MANKISVILDVATDKAISGLKGFKQSVSDADGAFGKVKAGAGSAFDSIKANAGVAGVAVVGAVGVMAAKSIEAASRLGESINAVNVTFGKSAEGIKSLGENAAEAVGLSNAEFNGLAVQFSSFADTIAGKGGDVVGTIDDMTHRAADFASVMNIDVAEAARLFQSGLAGETEPLKKFGIDLSAAAVEAHALETGLVANKSEMTESIKVQARYSLLMEKTEKTAGDFANTSDGLANSQRILAAKMEDTSAKVGKQLAPALAQITTMLSDLIPIAGTMAAGIGKAFEEVVDASYAVGKGFAELLDSLPFIEMADQVGPTLYEWEKLERANADLVAEFSEGSPTLQEFKQRLVDAGKSIEEINLATIEYAKQLAGTSEELETNIVQLDQYDERTQTATHSAASLAAAQEHAKETAEAQAEALEDLTQDLIDAVGASFNLEQATINLNSAYAAYQESLVATTATVNDSTVSDREKEQALRDLRTEEIGLAGEALATAEAYAQEKGAADGSAQSAQFQKDKLQQLAAAMPELREEIALYIDKLNAVPGVIRTRFEITATGATVTPNGDFIGIPGGARASGGPVAAGASYLVGERGMELFTPAVNGFITPHNQVAAGWSGAGAPAAGASVSVVVEGNIYGDKHLRGQLDSWARNVQRELNGAA